MSLGQTQLLAPERRTGPRRRPPRHSSSCAPAAVAAGTLLAGSGQQATSTIPLGHSSNQACSSLRWTSRRSMRVVRPSPTFARRNFRSTEQTGPAEPCLFRSRRGTRPFASSPDFSRHRDQRRRGPQPHHLPRARRCELPQGDRRCPRGRQGVANSAGARGPGGHALREPGQGGSVEFTTDHAGLAAAVEAYLERWSTASRCDPIPDGPARAANDR